MVGMAMVAMVVEVADMGAVVEAVVALGVVVAAVAVMVGRGRRMRYSCVLCQWWDSTTRRTHWQQTTN